MLACDDRLIDFHDMAAIRGMMVLVTGTSCTRRYVQVQYTMKFISYSRRTVL